MEKIKQNKIWITILVIGIIVIGILLAMLHQQKQNSPEAQSSSYVSSANASSASTSVQDKNNEKAYAKKAAKMKGHVFNQYFTTWSKQDFINWATNYLSTNKTNKQKDGLKENFGTSKTWQNDFSNADFPLDDIAKQIKSDGTVSSYYDSVKDFNKAYPAINPDDIKK